MTVHAAPKAVPKQSSPAHAPSLELRPARDRFESEAEHAAENALRPSQPAGPAPVLSPLPRSAGTTGQAAPAAVSEVVGSAGSPLGAPTRETMERGFRSDFSHVRIHTDAQAAASARAIRATAYTAGAHIVFGDGAYNPQSPRGRHILAHELAHVVQQRGATVPPAAVQRLAWYESIAVFFGAEGNFGDKELLAYLEKVTKSAAIEGSFDSDNKARAIVRRWKAGQAEFRLDPLQKALLILEMQDGPTLDDDENAILDLLELSDIAALRIMFGSGKLSVTELESDIDGAEYKRLKRFFATRFRGGRDALAKGDVEPQGEPGKGAPTFAYDAMAIKIRIATATNDEEIAAVAAEVFALDPPVREKAAQELGRERSDLARRLDDIGEQAEAESDPAKKDALKKKAGATKRILKNYDVFLQRVFRDVTLITGAGDLSKTAAPGAAQKADIPKALKPDVKVDSGGVALPFDNSPAGKTAYDNAIRAMMPDLIQRYWDEMVKDKGTTEHGDPTKVHALAEFERIGKASKDETDKVFGAYYDKSKHPELKADTAFTRGSIHDLFADTEADLAGMDSIEKRKMAKALVLYFFQSDRDIRAANRKLNASPQFDSSNNPVGDEAIILDKIADDFTSTDAQVDKLNEIDRGWDASASFGNINIQIFKKDDPVDDRDFLWDMFQTLIHEYIHTLRTTEYDTFANTFGDGSNENNTLIEGVDSLFDEIVWENVAPRVNDSRLREAVEGPAYAKLKPITVKPASRRRYASYAEAVKLVNIVGIRNLYAAYFQGDVAKIGG
ncbi:hypothetical protein ABIF86_005420 [Bradyrhizobium japonicum]